MCQLCAGRFHLHEIFQKEGVQPVLGVENFGMERTEQHKMVSLRNRRVKLKVFCFILLYHDEANCLFESREEETYREGDWRGCDRSEVIAVVNVEKLKC